jgi:pyruvate ferredoxin oxidoreductase gamma subunit
MYRIRLHGRGGQGMKTASRILGTALFSEGFEVQDAPRYGAERRGAPIFAYVRAAREPIHERGVIHRPDLVVVADDSLLGMPGVLEGLDERTALLINSDDGPDVWTQRLNAAGPVVTLPATADERAEIRFVGATCAGAAARLLGVVSRGALEAAIREELASMGEAVVATNLEKALGAYDALEAHAGCVGERPEVAADAAAPPAWIDLPFDEPALAAPDISAPATSVLVKTGAWRTMRPVIEYERCRHCTWVCSTLCPDGAITVNAEGAPEIDYDHCKGCLVCVAVCPHHAIAAIPEQTAAAAPTKISGTAPSGGRA